MADESEIMEPAATAQPAPGPQTHKEARFFGEGFKAGATAYAVAMGHSGLRSKNDRLRELMDKAGWETIEMFEKLSGDEPKKNIEFQAKPVDPAVMQRMEAIGERIKDEKAKQYLAQSQYMPRSLGMMVDHAIRKREDLETLCGEILATLLMPENKEKVATVGPVFVAAIDAWKRRFNHITHS